MRYKILNKTILTSALISLICLSTQQSLAQDVFDTESDDVLGVLPSAPGVETEEDIIPVSSEALIVPQTEEPSASGANNPVADSPAQKDIVAPVEAPQVVVPEKQVANVVLEKETIEAPVKTDLLPMDDDFEINFDNEPVVTGPKMEPQNPHNIPPKPASAQKINAPKPDTPAVKKPVVLAQPGMRAQKENGANQKISKELTFGEAILAQTNNDLFTQMSDIEKQTTLLTLELKKEKIKNEIEAAKAVRAKAAFDKQASEEAQKRAQIEWEKEQEAKVFQAQTELKQKEIELEKVKQRKALTAYMNSMLEQKQSWVNENAKLYEEIKTLRSKNTEMRQAYQKSLNDISSKMTDLIQSAETAQKDHDRAIVSLTAQNTQLKKRIEASEKAAQSHDGNPFAAQGGNGNNGKVQTSADSLIAPINIASEYAVVEILGKGDVLTVKLMNKDGDIFIAKQGTVLQTGHMVEEITPKFVRFSRNGLEDFLYTSSSAMEVEQSSIANDQAPKKPTVKAPVIPLVQEPQRQEDDDDALSIITETSLPSLGSTMFIK